MALKLENNEHTAIILDMYYYALGFARDNHFTPEKTSAFFSILKQTHTSVISTPLICLEKDYSFFKNLLLKHSIHRPPFSESVFTFAEMKLLREYVTHTYFRHYMMYKYAFTKKLRMELIVENFMPSAAETDRDVSEGDSERHAMGSMDMLAEGAARTAENGQDGESINVEGEPTGVVDGQMLSTEVTVGAADTQLSQVPGSVQSTSVTGPPSNGSPKDSAASQNTQQAGGQAVHITSQEAIPLEAKQFMTSNPSLQPEASKATASGSKQEAALAELKGFISSVLSAKLDEIRNNMQSKLAAQEETLNSKWRKIEGGNDEDPKKKDPKAKAKK
eukprot:jgi/Hompol1/6437/HPOL_003583-RA